MFDLGDFDSTESADSTAGWQVLAGNNDDKVYGLWV